MLIQSQPILIREFLQKNEFIIPLYQRPYKWTTDECETLWNDINKTFEEKNNGNNQDYFLGSIVVFKRGDGKYEIIDGQQRITTFTLLFRAFYETFKTENKASVRLSENFAKCIWNCEENYEDDGLNIKYSDRHLNNEVITETGLAILDNILSNSKIDDLDKNSKSNYIKNYMFLYNKLKERKLERTLDYENFCRFCLEETLNKGGLFILPIICDNQETALTIFNTLNSRGLPLTNSDLIKGNLYEHYKNKKDEKKLNEFLNIWKNIENKIEEDNAKHFESGIDTLFMQLMYIIKAEKEDRNTSTYKIVDFFTKKNSNSFYGAQDGWLYREDTLPFLEKLTDFWLNPLDFLTNKTYAYIKILTTLKSNAWKNFVAYLVWRNKCYINNKEEFSKEFDKYLPVMVKNLIIILLKNGNITNSNVTQIVIYLNVDIKQSTIMQRETNIMEQFFRDNLNNVNNNISFILHVYSYIYDYDNFSDFICTSYGDLQVEHILPKSWQKANFDGWTEESHKEYVEHIGNKILLERRKNIACSNNFFARKKEYYKESKLKEVKDIGNSEKNKWKKEDIEQRASDIYNKLKDFVEN